MGGLEQQHEAQLSVQQYTGRTTVEQSSQNSLAQWDVEKERSKVHLRIWRATVEGDWGAWERCFWDLRERAIPYDEATYTLLMHGYTLSHRHSTASVFAVLEEMKQAGVHPVLL